MSEIEREKKEEAENYAIFLEALGLPKEAVEEYRKALREGKPQMFEWVREDKGDE